MERDGGDGPSHLAKVGVAGSNPVVRSEKPQVRGAEGPLPVSGGLLDSNLHEILEVLREAEPGDPFPYRES